MRLLRICRLILIAVTFYACSTKPVSVGELDEIYVFADSSDWVDYEGALKSFFSKEYLMPVPEEEYILKYRPFSDFANYKHKSNIMLLARLDSNAPVSAEVNSLLNEEVMESVKSGDGFYIPQENVWAFNQYVVFLVAPSKDDMIQRLYDLGELVYDSFRKSYYTRLRNKMFKHSENKKIEKYIAENFPFTIRVQHDYVLVDESLKDNYIWLRRVYSNRDRSLVVHWIPNADSLQITRDWLIAERDSLALRVYSGDVVVPEETTFEQFRFRNWPAYRLEGTWKNQKRLIGGPFRTIAFKAKKENMIFMIDFYVQAIGERKKPYLDQLDIIAHTFKLPTAEQSAYLLDKGD